MAFTPQNFRDFSAPAVTAAWLNGVDQLVNNVFQGVTTVAQLQALVLATPLVLLAPITAAPTATINNIANQSAIVIPNTIGTTPGVPAAIAVTQAGNTLVNGLSVSNSTSQLTLGVTPSGTAIQSVGNIPLVISTNGTPAITIAGNQNVTMVALSTGTLNGTLAAIAGAPGGTIALTINSSLTGVAKGIAVNAGTGSSDYSVQFDSAAGSAYFQVRGDGAVIVGAPAAGAGTVGSINIQSFYVNGVLQAVSTFPAPFGTGVGTPTGTGLIPNFPGGSATLAQCSAAIAELVFLMKTAGWLTT
jgi:hypothetical protein